MSRNATAELDMPTLGDVHVRVADLEGRALDCLVAMYEGIAWERMADLQGVMPRIGRVLVGVQGAETRAHEWSPSTRDDHGAPILWRERMTLKPLHGGGYLASMGYDVGRDYVQQSGGTALIAGMRCLLASCTGERALVPARLARVLGITAN